jgi:hypothetical protein
MFPLKGYIKPSKHNAQEVFILVITLTLFILNIDTLPLYPPTVVASYRSS